MRDATFDYQHVPPQSSVWESALGLRPASGLERLEEVQGGLPARAFQRFAETIHVDRPTLAKAIGVSLRTLQRRAETGGRLDAGPSERLVRLADLYAQAARVVGDEASALRWMRTPRDVFGDLTPLEMAGSELGAGEVQALLMRVEQGVFY